LDIYVDSIEEALIKCTELKNNGKADLFRGQTRDWPTILPSLLRLNNEEKIEAEKKLHSFLSWASNVTQMSQYQTSEESLIAIAQHYGIATNFLDLTTSPEIALIFSKVENEEIDSSSRSVIYCFSETTLNKINNGKLIKILVDNLWRLENQFGLFLEFYDETLIFELREMSIRIHYPTVKLNESENKLIYPEQKSHLETVIDEWFYRYGIEVTLNKMQTKYQIQVNRNRSYPGVFKWRNIPLKGDEWELKKWNNSPVEIFSNLKEYNEINISSLKGYSSKKIYRQILEILQKPIHEYYKTGKGMFVSISISTIDILVSQRINKFLNRCWDGIRVLPYNSNELIKCMTLTATLLIGRALKIKNVNNWTQELLGDIEYLEVAPTGGYISAGYVSSKDLNKTFSKKNYNLTKYFYRKVKEKPKYIMDWLLEPWLIFEFKEFKRIYIEQFIPTSIDGFLDTELEMGEILSDDMWSTSFNPTSLSSVTNSDYRITSPISMESEPSSMIYITPEMTKGDMEEMFAYCLIYILNNGNPYQIRFSGYEYDERELWEIEHVIKQCKWIVEISGISVLEVMIEGQEEFKPNGLGAWNIWLIANRLIEKDNEITIDEGKKYYEEFWDRLMFSNDDLEKRMNNLIEKEKSV